MFQRHADRELEVVDITITSVNAVMLNSENTALSNESLTQNQYAFDFTQLMSEELEVITPTVEEIPSFEEIPTLPTNILLDVPLAANEAHKEVLDNKLDIADDTNETEEEDVVNTLSWFNLPNFTPPEQTQKVSLQHADDVILLPAKETPKPAITQKELEVNKTQIESLPEVPPEQEASIPEQIAIVFSHKDIKSLQPTDSIAFDFESIPKEEPEVTIQSMVTTITNPVDTHQTNKIPAHTLMIRTEVSEPDWGNAFNHQVMWLSQQKMNTATISLNPKELGPIDLNIQVHAKEAHITINTYHQDINELLQQTMPRLRDMLQNEGLNLTQVQIDTHVDAQTGSHAQERRFQHQMENHATVHDENVQDTLIQDRKTQGVVDYFA